MITKKIFFPLAIVALALVALCWTPVVGHANRLRDINHGDILPEMTLQRFADGSEQRISPAKLGKPSVIVFFSIRPDFRKKRSLALLAVLSELNTRFKNSVSFLAILSDDKGQETVAQYMADSASHLDLYIDSRKNVYNQYGVFMMPLVVLADRQGGLYEVIPYTYNIRELVEGNLKVMLGQWDRKKLEESLKPKEMVVRSKEEKEYIRRINYGRVMSTRKMYAQAIREFSTAVKLMPKLIDAYIELGNAQLAVKDWLQAERSFKEALKIDSESDAAIAGLGLALYGRGDVEAALPVLENAFIAPEPRLEVIIALAEIHEAKGNMTKAIRLNKLAVSRLMTMYEHKWQ